MKYGGFPSSDELEQLRRRYPSGTRVRLNHMDDAAPVPQGTEGTVLCVDDAGQLLMQWDNGRSLALVPGIDSFEVINGPQINQSAPSL